MNKKINSLVEAIEDYDGDEYFNGGVSYCIALDQIEINESVEKSIKGYIEQLTNNSIKDDEMLRLNPILNYEEDLNNIFDEWHIKNSISDSLLQILSSEEVMLYKFKIDNYFISYGNVYSILRILKAAERWYAVEFYITD